MAGTVHTQPARAREAAPTHAPAAEAGVPRRPRVEISDHARTDLPAGSAEARRFLRWLAVTALVLVAAVAAFNAFADPFAIVGTGRYRATSDWVNREEKVNLIAHMRTAPGVLVLGSSTVRAIDPAVIHRLTGHTAFNAGVSAGTPIDMYAMAAYVAERFPHSFPHVVWGLNVEGFRDVQPDAALVRSSALNRQLPLWDRVRFGVQLYAPLFDLRTTSASWDTIEQGPVPRLDVSHLHQFRADGFLAGADPLDGRSYPRELAKIVNEYGSTMYRNGSFQALGGNSTEYVRRLVELCNAHGDTPTIYISPMVPQAQQELGPEGYYARRRDALAFLHALNADGHHVHVVDLSNVSSFGGSPSGFYDAVHMHRDMAAKLLAALEARGVLQ
jgi:hypothetical protein